MPTQPEQGEKPRQRWLWRGIIAVSFGIGALILVIVISNAVVLVEGSGDSVSDPADAPQAQAAIVLGALVEPDGDMSKMLADRVEQGINLYEDGKVEKILVSGDHGQWTYDEPTVMKNAFVEAGIPARDVFTDHAGFNTRASMERAKDVFGVESALIVTQGFHMTRALYLADAAGLDAYGVTSDLHSYGGQGLKSQVREVASRTKAFFDVLTNTAAVGGPSVPITGDGRTSWGPSAPGSD